MIEKKGKRIYVLHTEHEGRLSSFGTMTVEDDVIHLGDMRVHRRDLPILIGFLQPYVMEA